MWVYNIKVWHFDFRPCRDSCLKRDWDKISFCCARTFYIFLKISLLNQGGSTILLCPLIGCPFEEKNNQSTMYTTSTIETIHGSDWFQPQFSLTMAESCAFPVLSGIRSVREVLWCFLRSSSCNVFLAWQQSSCSISPPAYSTAKTQLLTKPWFDKSADYYL